MAKMGFHTGWSGSPFHTGYQANEGAQTGPDGKPSIPGPRIGSGYLGTAVKAEVDRTEQSGGNGRRSGRGRRNG